VVYRRVPDEYEGTVRLRRCSSCKDPGDRISPTTEMSTRGIKRSNLSIDIPFERGRDHTASLLVTLRWDEKEEK
jgi:hypothetical protein